MKKLVTSLLAVAAIVALPQVLLADGPDKPKRDGDREGQRRAERPDHHRGHHGGRPEASRRDQGPPQARHHGHPSRAGSPHGRRPMGPMAGGPPRMPDPAKVFDSFDKDDDGQLSKEEFTAGTRRVHAMMMARRGGPPSRGPGGPQMHRRPGGPPSPGGPRRPGMQPGRPSPEMMKKHFQSMDKNDDGKLNKDEAPGHLKAHFEKIDANKDGQLEPEEMKKAFEKFREHMKERMQARAPGRPGGPPGPGGPPRPGMQRRPGGPPTPGGPGRPGMSRGGPTPEMMKKHFEMMDKDDNGKLSKEEAPGHMKAHFDKVDANSDGQLEPEELKKAMEKFREQMKERMQGRAPGRRPGGPPSRGPGASRGQGSPQDRFKAADKDGDGKLSKDEAPERLKQHFDKIDADNDGQVTPEEMRKAFEKMRERAEA